MVQADQAMSNHRPTATRRLILVALAMGVLTVGPFGCVSRRLTIRSNPPGAQVYVDNYEIGSTPCSTDFIYYGTRQIRLIKDGYETLTVDQPIPAPWYQVPPIDFVTENLVPHEMRDERTLSYNMTPQVIVPTEHLLGRAEQLRASAQTQGSLVAPPSTAPPYLGPAVTSPPPPQGVLGEEVPRSYPTDRNEPERYDPGSY